MGRGGKVPGVSPRTAVGEPTPARSWTSQAAHGIFFPVEFDAGQIDVSEADAGGFLSGKAVLCQAEDKVESSPDELLYAGLPRPRDVCSGHGWLDCG